LPRFLPPLSKRVLPPIIFSVSPMACVIKPGGHIRLRQEGGIKETIMTKRFFARMFAAALMAGVAATGCAKRERIPR